MSRSHQARSGRALRPVVTGDGDASSEADMPPSGPMRLIRPHSYRETRFDRGVYHWAAGEIITNPDEIAHLIQRGAHLEPCPCPDQQD